MNDCEGAIHPAAAEGIRLFNRGAYFEAHEALEEAWRAEQGPIRELYRGILQIAVAYLHITRNNYEGAIKVYGRSLKWMKAWPETCRGIQVGQLRLDAEKALAEAQRLGPRGLQAYDFSLMKPVIYAEKQAGSEG
jgi:predicted metal-dependent hydrolase